ncbi:MAG: hypothetical protein EOR67_04145 [Mesorhizobium sp.]|uniref:hypothetical protein n=1 Tax=Mesorhizobium sp. TaxID=1871066 RepID=UPI000FE90313|nr:hypothetical protein [Mesorhizobium sp.]RWL83442.1 MAG: hypothetical protein EOR69_11805 [Mesorhizobium sp.]RWL90595.1 MAG: hypothetical protein EOR67_04145 [Mesorhizobium sp.]RWM00183.1 MAG: hypothetical protein EOR70_09375 [Mesorhizobium sp.]TIP03981.1 MAG: hypothetical protein E5X72_13865 [Mesorhizobium sp.]TJV68066.1 MAG: hypothetical protein E5X76_31175 [Mesorhizobium sp.]
MRDKETGIGIDREHCKRAGKASTALASLMPLGGCVTRQPTGIDAYQTSGIDQWLATADADKAVNAWAGRD